MKIRINHLKDINIDDKIFQGLEFHLDDNKNVVSCGIIIPESIEYLASMMETTINELFKHLKEKQNE